MRRSELVAYASQTSQIHQSRTLPFFERSNEVTKIPIVNPWHSVKGVVYHNHTECNTGNNIETEYRRSGTGGKTRCQECASLIVDYENARFKIAAFSKSNAQLTRFKIHVPQYIIGHSFDTWFEITNLKDEKSPRLNFTIEVKMGEYSYHYERQLESIPARATYKTAPINWKVLNQGVCTFSFNDIIIAGDSLTIARAKTIFVNTNGKFVETDKVFHSVVTTTPEGVYEYWAMVISAIGLTIIALEKLWPIIIGPLIKFIIFLVQSMGAAV